MADFEIVSDFKMTGDQPEAVEGLVKGLNSDFKHQTLLGVTGSGKTFTMANVIERVQKPTLVISHNKTLAAQLYQEFREFFPNNAVEYFVSYYDYYQPEAYIPRTDLYIEKDAEVNDEIDKLRHAATRALFEQRDVIIVASVSCIYGLGSPDEYYSFVCSLKKGESYNRYKLLHKLVEMQYERNDTDFARGKFRVRGDTLEIQPAYEEIGLRIEFFGDEVERIVQIDPLTGELLSELDSIDIYPAKHFVTSEEKLVVAIERIKEELEERLNELKQQDKKLEASRLEQRTNYDHDWAILPKANCSALSRPDLHFPLAVKGQNRGRKADCDFFTQLHDFSALHEYLLDHSRSHRRGNESPIISQFQAEALRFFCCNGMDEAPNRRKPDTVWFSPVQEDLSDLVHVPNGP